MTRMTQDEWMQREAAAERVGAKLHSFLSGLPDDEQQVLTIALIDLARLAGDGQDDVSGYYLAGEWGIRIAQSMQEHPAAWRGAAVAANAAMRAMTGNTAAVFRYLAD